MTEEGKTSEQLIDELQVLLLRVAELEQSEAGRQRVEKELQQVALFPELAPAPVLRFDSRGIILFANSAAVAVLGEQAQKGMPLVSLLPGIAELNLKQCIELGLTMPHEATIGEQYFQFTIRGVPEIDAGYIYSRDITEVKKAEERLLTVERLATLGQFSGDISHELRNPLGVIASSAYYLKTRLKDADEKVREHLNRIQSSVDKATAVIQSLLDLTQMKKSQLARLDLVAFISGAITTAEVPARIKVIRNFPESEVLVNADREQLSMVFRNIIANAVEAMAGRGTLTVAIGTKDGQAEVSFTDTGTGILADNLDKIFQPFFSTKTKGIGFGLPIARMVVERHGGIIQAGAAPGRGATFTIQLPLGADKVDGA